MRRGICKRFADADPFGIERVGRAADRGLGSFIVDVPTFEMLERPRVHHDQRRVDDAASVHKGG